MKIRIDKATRILNDYELFVVENTLFSSPMLIEKMLPLERKRAKVCLKNDVSASEAPCNLLEINSTSFKEEKRIEEKRKEEKTTTSSSSKEEDVAADDDVIKQSWRKPHPVTFRSQETFKLLPHTRQHSLPKAHATPQADVSNTEQEDMNSPPCFFKTRPRLSQNTTAFKKNTVKALPSTPNNP